MQFLEAPPASNDSGWPTNPENAYANDDAYAIATTTDDTCVYYNFDFSDIPSGSQIVGIRVCIHGDWHDPGSTDITNPYYNVELTWNGSGTPTWTTAQSTPYLTEDGEFALYVGGPSDNWGHSWTLAEIQDTDDFRLRVTSKSTGVTGVPEWRIDFIEVAVYYYGGALYGSVDFTETIETSIVPATVYEELGVNDSGSKGALASTPPTTVVSKAGTAITDYQSSTTAQFDAAATYQRMEGCIVRIAFTVDDNATLFIADEKVVQWPDDTNPLVQASQYGLISIDSITYSSDYGSPQSPAQASITVANKKYGNPETGVPVYIPQMMSGRSFLGAEITVYAMVREIKTTAQPWRQRVIFKGSVTDVICKDTEIIFNATQIGHGDLPVPDQTITDDTFYYAENDYGGQAGREGNKIEERMGAVIPIGIGRFDIHAVQPSWSTGHIMDVDSSTSPRSVYTFEKTARGIIPAMMGVKFPMMPCVAAVRNWTGRHALLSESGGKVSGRECEIYQQVYLHGSKKGISNLYVSHGWMGTFTDYTLGADPWSTTAAEQPAYLVPIYTWNTDEAIDAAMPFVKDMSPRSIYESWNRYDQLRIWGSAGSMHVGAYRWTDGDARHCYGVFVNIGATADGANINMLTEKQHFSSSLQAIAVPFESLSTQEGWCRGENYFSGEEGATGSWPGGKAVDADNMVKARALDSNVTLHYDNAASPYKKGAAAYQFPVSVPGSGDIWGVRVGGIWNPEAGTPGQLEMIGRYAGPYDPNPGRVPSDHPLYSNGWPFLGAWGPGMVFDDTKMHQSVNVEFDLWGGDSAITHKVRIPSTSNYRYFAWWIRSPWFYPTSAYEEEGPHWMVTPSADPRGDTTHKGMTQAWEFMSWGWDSGLGIYLMKYPWDVRFACGQTGAGSESIILNKAWMEVIFKSQLRAETELPKKVRDYPRIPAREEGGPYNFRDPSAFRYLWRKGIYPTQQNDSISAEDIYITGEGIKASGVVVEKAPDVAAILIQHYTGGTKIASGSSFGSFDTANTMLSSITMSLIVNYQSSVAGVLGEIGRQSGGIVEEQIDDDGELQYRFLADTDDPTTDDPARMYRSDVNFHFKPEDIFEGSFNISTTRLEDLTSDIRLRYGWHLPSGTWANEVWLNRDGTNLDTDAATYVAAAQSTYDDYGVENQQIHEFPDIWNKAAADTLLKWLFNKQRRRLVMVDFTTYVRHSDLRCGHVIKFHDAMSDVVRCPSEVDPDWENILFNVLGVSYSRDVDGFMRVQVLAQETYTSAA